MAIFEKIGDTLVNVGRDVTQKAKDVSGIAKLRIDIRAKEDFIKEQYLELGKAYYEEHKGDAVKEQPQFDRIDEALEAIEEMEQQILALKKARVCPECGAEVSDEAGYCSTCGAKLSVVEEEAPCEAAEEAEEVAEAVEAAEEESNYEG